MPKALTTRLPWMVSCNRAVRCPSEPCPLLLERRTFLYTCVSGRIVTGKTIKASRARNQSFRNATTTNAARVVVSLIIEAVAWVSASRTTVVSLVTRERIVPVGFR